MTYSVEDYLKGEYEQANSWAQHYSDVRMNVAVFLVPTSLGILAFGWEKSLPNYQWFAGITWGSALFIFSFFTHLTQREREYSKRLRELRNGSVTLPTSLAQINRTPHSLGHFLRNLRTDGAFYIGLLLTVAFLIGLWSMDPKTSGPG